MKLKLRPIDYIFFLIFGLPSCFIAALYLSWILYIRELDDFYKDWKHK